MQSQGGMVCKQIRSWSRYVCAFFCLNRATHPWTRHRSVQLQDVGAGIFSHPHRIHARSSQIQSSTLSSASAKQGTTVSDLAVIPCKVAVCWMGRHILKLEKGAEWLGTQSSREEAKCSGPYVGHPCLEVQVSQSVLFKGWIGNSQPYLQCTLCPGSWSTEVAGLSFVS